MAKSKSGRPGWRTVIRTRSQHGIREQYEESIPDLPSDRILGVDGSVVCLLKTIDTESDPRSESGRVRLLHFVSPTTEQLLQSTCHDFFHDEVEPEVWHTKVADGIASAVVFLGRDRVIVSWAANVKEPMISVILIRAQRDGRIC